ncbi:MAG: hypothetical protein O2931_09295 [Planctomycetota bacterium]|nr:hypothetical protein [Planctomycetota bacterium]MDA1178977.1 hypothetical protein [Planctomycetota bacterium]
MATLPRRDFLRASLAACEVAKITEIFRIAGAQIDIHLGNKSANFDHRVARVEVARVELAGADEETLIYADLDVRRLLNKQRVRMPGRHCIDLFINHRPEMYGPLVKPLPQDIVRSRGYGRRC